MEYTSLKTEELIAMKTAIEEELKKRNGKAIIKLKYNQYKGSGKCWVAVIDPVTKEKLGFVNATSINKTSNYSGEKIFELEEGNTYMTNEAGTKSSDTRKIVIVSEGQIKEGL